MRRYETTIIVDPDLPEDDRTALFDRIKEIIVQQQGVLVHEDPWGTRKLAYEIKKKPRGFYARYDYCGMGSLVSELERFFRIDDRLMKYLTVQLEADADVEKIKAEMANAGKNQNESSTETEPRAKADAALTQTEATGTESQVTETAKTPSEEE